MALFTAWLIIVVVVLAAVSTCYIKHMMKLVGSSPIAWPIVGMLPSLFVNVHCLYDWLTSVLVQHGGSFRFVGPCMHCVITCDPRNIEHVLRTHFHNYPKGPYTAAVFNDLLGQGIFNVDHDLWRLQRKAASLEFHSPRFRRFMEETVTRLVHDKLLPLLMNASEKKSAVDFQDVFLRYTFDTVCLLNLGVDTGCLSNGLALIPFANAFEVVLEATAFRFLIPISTWKVLRSLKLGKEKKLHGALQQIEDFMAALISMRRKELKREQPKLEQEVIGADLLSCFMLMENEGVQQHSDKFLRDVALSFILAGRDTSGVALSWFFWLLIENPQVEEKIMQEMKRILEKRKSGSDRCNIEEPFSKDELRDMQYLHAALSETLRLYPSVPINIKQAAKNDVLPDGSFVKAGEGLVYSLYSMGRMESIWGKGCCEFKPERWLVGDRFVAESAFRYPVFNAGPRMCLGKELAYLQMKAAAAAILRQFKDIIPHPNMVPYTWCEHAKHRRDNARASRSLVKDEWGGDDNSPPPHEVVEEEVFDDMVRHLLQYPSSPFSPSLTNCKNDII